MNYLQVEKLSKAYGEKVLFTDISFGIDRGQKVALIARNGTGKSTLMSILAGKDAADSGKITFRNDLRIGYLSQNPEYPAHTTVFDALFLSDSPAIAALRQYEYALNLAKSHPGKESEDLLHEALSKMDAAEAWTIETRTNEILGRFSIHDLDQKMGELSGGQVKKVALAHMLIDTPDLLLMDEPTNHLDFEMIEWLEDYLSNDSLSLLLITHDRYFLDNVCDTIIEMERNSLFTYKGNYSYYLEKKAERHDNDTSIQEKAKNLYRTELEWIRRMPKARGTKSKARIESFSELEEKVKSISREKEIHFNVQSKLLGGKIIEINNICKSFDKRNIIDDFSYIFKRGERIGVVGLNGTGKSTLLKLISGELQPDKGRIVTGQTVNLSHYSQDGLQLIEDKRVIDIVKSYAEEILLTKGSVSAAQFLYHFNFSYPVQQAYFTSLSGGEKRRLYLLLQLINNPNVLLLDEPTNDLDIYTLQILEEFLLEFPGCVVVVSHDRFLLDKLCDHVFVFEGNGRIKDYYGNYTTYYRERIKQIKAKARAENQEKAEKTERKPESGPKPAKPSYKQQKEYEQLEADIARLEDEKAKITKILSEANTDSVTLTTSSVRYSEVEAEIEEKSMRWLELAEIMG